jgi:hypothetical protein
MTETTAVTLRYAELIKRASERWNSLRSDPKRVSRYIIRVLEEVQFDMLKDGLDQETVNADLFSLLHAIKDTADAVLRRRLGILS